MSRGGKKNRADLSERKCIATGESHPKAGLIRFVVNPEGEIVPDLAEKLPGRGIWVSADREALGKAVKKGLFARGAKQSVKTNPELLAHVETLLVKRLIELISLARKAGQAIAGLERVKSVLISEKAVCLIQASDGSEREKKRLRPPEGEKTYFDAASAAELGLAFGRDRVIHAALIAGGLSTLVRYESARLAGLRRSQA